jgi:membrane-associated protease RseP (regulator of RpoE activity)
MILIRIVPRFAALGVLMLASSTGVAWGQQPPIAIKPPTSAPQGVVADWTEALTGSGVVSEIKPYLGQGSFNPIGRVNVNSATVTDKNGVLYLVANKTDPTFDLLGVQLAPLTEAMRAQLNLGDGSGAYITKLRSKGPCELAGLKAFDVLVAVGDHAIKAPDDLTKYLRAAGEGNVNIKIVRAGKPEKVTVRPVYHVSVAPASAEKKEYYLGVSLRPLDDALRSQLSMPAGRGVLISEIVKGSPAAEAGLKPFDIIIDFGEKGVESPEKFAALVQSGQDKPAALRILRGGSPRTIMVTPAVRTAEIADVDHELAFVLGLSRDVDDALKMRSDVVRLRTTSDAETERALLTERALAERATLRKFEADHVRHIEELRRQVRELQETINRLEKRGNERK